MPEQNIILTVKEVVKRHRKNINHYGTYIISRTNFFFVQTWASRTLKKNHKFAFYRAWTNKKKSPCWQQNLPLHLGMWYLSLLKASSSVIFTGWFSNIFWLNIGVLESWLNFLMLMGVMHGCASYAYPTFILQLTWSAHLSVPSLLERFPKTV